MIAAIGGIVLVLLVGARCRPRPPARRVDQPSPDATSVDQSQPQRQMATVQRRQRTGRRHRRVTRDIERQLPDAIDLLVLAVRAGLLPAAAFAEVTPQVSGEVRTVFEQMLARLSAGERFGEALRVLDRLGPHGAALAEAFASAERLGLPLQPVLAQLSAEARAARRRHAEARARELPVRMAMPLVLCTLPSFVVLAILPLLLSAFSTIAA